ncbi:MAG: dephospho-CoA kinase [candidate division Zixibacteria bacterium RBG_16_53_22]|nr:MAG: dephospho-CoA kinase [candidate division Zixibacteria bacterium RBG_16_53_22]
MPEKRKSVIIGLTGGPGTGKSLAAKFLRNKGAVVLSGDEAGKRAVETRSVRDKLVKAFGREILKRDGGLDRRKLGRIVFGDPDELEKLNDIVHPGLLRILKADLEEQKRKRVRLVVIDAALIFEWMIANWCDYILVVTARRDIRMERLIKSGLTRKEAIDRINSQIPDRDKAALADYVIENNGTKAEFRRKVDEFVNLIIVGAFN